MAQKLEWICGALAGIAGALGFALVAFRGVGLTVDSTVLLSIGLLLALGITLGAYVHSHYDYGLWMLWLSVVLLLPFGVWGALSFAPSVLLGITAGVCGIRNQRTLGYA